MAKGHPTPGAAGSPRTQAQGIIDRVALRMGLRAIPSDGDRDEVVLRSAEPSEGGSSALMAFVDAEAPPDDFAPAVHRADVTVVSWGAPTEAFVENAVRIASGGGPRRTEHELAELFALSLRTSGELRDIEGLLADRLVQVEAPPPLARRIRSVALELLTNALYDAPRGPDGSRLFAHLDRRTAVTLPASQEVRCSVSVAQDGHCAEITVRDGFGSLDPVLLVERFVRAGTGNRQVLEETGGAGLGLFFVLDAIDWLVVEIAPGEETHIWAKLVFGHRNRTPAELCVRRRPPAVGK